MNDVLILMSDNRPIITDIDTADYNSLVAMINFNYSIKHQYDFKYFIPKFNNEITTFNCLSPTNELRHSAWSKLLSVIKAIKENKHYKYIVYVDSDCIFHNQENTIFNYLTTSKNINKESLNKNADVFFMNNQPWEFNLPCSGFFILKPNDYCLKFFEKWYMNNNKPIYNKKHIWEQYPLQYDILPIERNNIEIINDWMFREFKGQFLRHIGSEEKQNRIPFFKNYLVTNIPKVILEKFKNEMSKYISIYETSKFFE
jgi:hypothetical protein